MKNGDISNETPPRIIVGIELVVDSELVENRRFLATTKERKVLSLQKGVLKKLWNIGYEFGVAIELAAIEEFGWTQKHLDDLMDRLERRGGNPFNHAELYPTQQEFIDELPYRANLRGVTDTPERAGAYGSWRFDLEQL